MEYNLTIQSVECAKSRYGLENVVIAINWEYSVSNETKSYTIGGKLEVPEPNPIQFTPIEELTNEIVTTWVNSMIDFEGWKPILEEQLNKQDEVEEIVTIQLK